MRRLLKIAMTVVLWSALAAYLFVAARYCREQSAGRICNDLNINIIHTDFPGLVTPDFVRGVVAGAGLQPVGMPVEAIDLAALEGAIAARPNIRRVRAYTSLDDRLNIEVEPRDPVARVQTDDGHRFYLSDDGWALPVREGFPIEVPIVTGKPALPVEPDFFGKIPQNNSPESVFLLHNLFNFVKFLRDDSFWYSQIVQIVVNEANEVDLVPRVGRGIVKLGTLGAESEGGGGYEEKLAKLYKFYTKGLNYEGWDKYGVIDIRYRGQVVCTE